MKTPKRIQPLIDEGIIDEVLRPLMSGKEASVYVVRCGNAIRCAKVYKDASQRSFKKAVQYQEGRKVRSSRRARAMEKGSSFGREQQEESWQHAEVDALYKLADAGVRVPEPYGCYDGILLMELILDEDGDVAPRLNDITLEPEQAKRDHKTMMQHILRMLAAGLVHGDLSEFNVLQDPTGPVIIDLPQAVDAAANNNAQWMLSRDVNNITQYYGQFAPELLNTKYAKEIWALFEAGNLNPDTELTGEFAEDEQLADIDAVLDEINAAYNEMQERKARNAAAEQDD
ncbi:serine protein kinase RIO [Alishewanella sp. 16-MA]|uniref:non-specific serine/threonine protein kinase n=1 Tax=Alishewanella maricola TaxID=2795740 RepID=A0ABS8C0Z4_9ALTE|nr:MULTISPECIES: PA4780 family RIO1-like protein kinase [Gammaproteobacteria]MDP5035551.1 serine protein kinase RIO [Alishewanella sp.]MCB5225979.1 serine protein kinase RIO [Alishewanella maricola]MCC5450174.1 serine protein kinase RIO [Rheinheimera sp. UJ51]MDP5186976.1 serine protein kinase RIO [Alishewanella sp.]MDP5460220.1 PA4780 family RIO1-like protein kinase [Alishewanella sp. SMS8]